jgi:N12 class adenine-specific DNA methylase
MTHSGFGLLPVSSATEDAFLEEQVTSYRRAMSQDEERGRSMTVKNLNKAIDRMRQRQAALRDKPTDTGSVTWEQLGVDYLMVDEATCSSRSLSRLA